MLADRLFSVILIFISIVFWSACNGLQYNCSVFPRALAVLLILLSMILMFQTDYRKRAEKKTSEKDDLKYILFTVITVFAWIGLLDVFGFLVSGVFFLSILKLMIQFQKPTFSGVLSTVVVSALVVGVFWYVFHHFLLVPLPTGYLI